MIAPTPQRSEDFLGRDSEPARVVVGNGEAPRDTLDGLLDQVHTRLSDGQVGDCEIREELEVLFLGLRGLKLNASEDDWCDCVRSCRSHPLRSIIHEDPFTYRAFSKPRGYAGDAKLLDFIYGREEQWRPPETTRIGACVFDFTTMAPASEGVRARRGFIADLIDRLAEESHKPHILSIAAGHLREASLCAAVKRRKIGRFVALDGDDLSLQEVQRCYSYFGVETAEAKVRSLLTNRVSLGDFDLVYSTGLFDYLQQSTGRRLVSNMFQMLRPGGRLVVANFLPGVRDIGYMEAYMDWTLVYRTRRDMIDLTMEIPQSDICNATLFSEENQNIIFLEVIKS